MKLKKYFISYIMYILQRTDRDQRISLHRCSYSLDPTTDNLHDFVNGTGQDTNAANKLPALGRAGLRPAG